MDPITLRAALALALAAFEKASAAMARIDDLEKAFLNLVRAREEVAA